MGGKVVRTVSVGQKLTDLDSNQRSKKLRQNWKCGNKAEKKAKQKFND